MAARNKPYEQFGPYILFKKLEQDSLGDLWRAGQIAGGQIGPALAVRRLSGGDRSALSSAVEAVSQLLPRLTGTSFARDQVAGIHEGVPFLAWDYAGGRSLRHIMERSRGGKDSAPNPLPIDQAIVIAERVALSLATTGDMRDTTGARLSHGTLLPQFVWVSDDGEIRVAGQQLSPGIVASLASPAVAADIGRYVAPEFRASGQAPKNADVYAMGALLFLVITGQEPPDAMTASAFVSAVRAAKTTTGAPIPDDIRVILDKSFNLDPSMRFASMSEMKQALSALAHGGKYSATTFNLAFYLSNLLKKDMEIETAEREKESKLNLAPYLEQPKPVPVAPQQPLPGAVVMPDFDAPPALQPAAPKSRAPLAAAALVFLVAAGGGAWMLFGRTPAAPELSNVATAAMVPAAPATKPVVIPEPIVAAGSTETAGDAMTSSAADPADPEAQKRAFEAAVRQKLQAEMMKLQSDYMSELQKQQSRNAPVAAAPPPAPAQQTLSPEERATLSAAQFDQQRREASSPAEATTETRAPLPSPVAAQTQTVAPAPVQAAAPAPAPAPAPVVREGDVIDYSDLDDVPRAIRAIAPVYPQLARQQRISATVVVTALINESGVVTDVKVLRGNGKFGIDEAAIRAVRAARFTSPMKSGKRVKTWMPQTIQFKP